MDKSCVPFTAREVALALKIFDCEDMLGEDIAKEMLDGLMEFSREELEKLAAFKGLSLEFLTENDPSLRRYEDPVLKARKGIASNLINRGFCIMFVNEICGLKPRF
jgi:hypothetical protein